MATVDTPETEDLDKILEELEPDHIPAEFVVGGMVTYLDYRVQDVSIDELNEIMDNDHSLEEQGIDDVCLIINIQGVKEAIKGYSESILQNIPL